MKQKLYHASECLYQPGDIITASRETSFGPEVFRLLESVRPHDAPSRSVCLFATDSAANAYEFARAEGMEAYYIYEVETESFRKAPMLLVDEIKKRLDAGSPYEELLMEYWYPTEDWRFYEYFGQRFKILGFASSPSRMETYMVGPNCSMDSQTAKQLGRDKRCSENISNGN